MNILSLRCIQMAYILVSIYRKALIFVKKYALEDFSNGKNPQQNECLRGRGKPRRDEVFKRKRMMLFFQVDICMSFLPSIFSSPHIISPSFFPFFVLCSCCCCTSLLLFPSSSSSWKEEQQLYVKRLVCIRRVKGSLDQGA